ncbi:MAG: PQQ-dependent sugar dehydrogenase [bacterium]
MHGEFARRISRLVGALAVVMAASSAGALNIALTPFANGFSRPVDITHAGDTRLFVVEKPGYISIVQPDGTVLATPFLDIHTLVSGGNEEGLLGLAFHPQYATNGFFYVYYTNTSGDIRVVRYTVSGNPDLANSGSALPIIAIAHPTNSNHNGGGLHFGPDGYLYVSTGDGGSGCDPPDNGQNGNALLGKLLRLDVDSGSPYAIPASNPYVGPDGVADEIWALGLRNPWRFSFDRANGNLYIGDVGQNQIEEIDFQLAGGSGGENYGWDCFEGSSPASISGCTTTAVCTPLSAFIFPVHEYTHSDGCSITGGYIYRGSASPSLSGIYFYSDYCAGEFWGLTTPDNGTTWNNQSFGFPVGGLNPTAFGEDAAGEIYVAGDNGTIYRLSGSAPPPGCPPAPAAGCTATAKSSIAIKQNADPNKSKLLWKWLKGPALNQSDFGNPVSGASSYSLCAYAGTSAVVSVGYPGVTGWKTAGTTGYKYADKTLASDGALKASLKAGATDKSKLLLKAKGSNLDVSALPLGIVSSLTVQLVRSDAAQCWEAVFPAVAVKKDDAAQFKAKIP